MSEGVEEHFRLKFFTPRLNIVGDTRFFIFLRVSANYLISD